MQILGDILKKAASFLKEKEVSESRLSAEWLLADILKMNRVDLYMNFDRPLSEQEISQYRSYIARRLKREPISYIMGSHSFLGINLKVTQDVLIPRPETEELVVNLLKVVQDKKNCRVLDLCTGSAAIACAIKKNRPDFEVYGSDICEKALKVATTNAQDNNLDVTFIHSDLCENIKDQFDIVISNPPYISTKVISTLEKDVSEYEPHVALNGGADGLDMYRKLKDQLPTILKNQALVFLEIGYDQGQDVVALFSDVPYYNGICIQDSHLNNRFVTFSYRDK